MLARSITTLCLSAFLLAPAHPDFSGYWQLDKSRSQLAPTTTMMWMRIEHSGPALAVSLRTFQVRGEEDHTFIYAIGTKDNANSMHGAPMKSDVAWDGDALNFHSVAMFGKDALTMDDHWTLSADENELEFHQASQFAQEPQRQAVLVFTRRQPKDWPEDTSTQPAEKQFKNIQALTGIRASQLPTTMTGFTRALGVPCSQCHVVGRFELDEKPDKQLARKMIAMTARLNAENFAGAPPVTCFTCHRGALQTQNAPR